MYAGTLEVMEVEGKVPADVLKAWTGLVLPYFPQPRGVTYFSVPQDVALATLAEKSPAAAAWYFKERFPFRGGGFKFEAHEVKLC